MDRTNSVFRALQTPVTSAPSAAAIWTANVPTPPAAPFTRTRCPGWTLPRSRIACSAVTAAIGGVGGGVFGEGPAGKPEHLVTWPRAVHVGADVLNSTGDVDAGDSGLRFGYPDAAHEAGDARVTADHVPVVGVDRGGVHLDEHFA